MDFWSVLTICITTIICVIICTYGNICVETLKHPDDTDKK